MIAALGIDTSCYTTSVALAMEDGFFLRKSKLLSVKPGERGMRQSEALFQHVQSLPGLLEDLFADTDAQVCAVCASVKPRDLEDSYMPVFLAGEGAARSIAAAKKVKFFATSHQQGHVRAAQNGVSLCEGDFLAVHLSGGTTEIVRATQSLQIDLLGGTSDISAGQLLDRVGVAMGLSFPAGREMDELAMGQQTESIMPTSLAGYDPSFSGAEAQAMRIIESGVPREHIAADLFSLISRTIAKMIQKAAADTHIGQVLLAGGVACSGTLRQMLPERLHRLGCDIKLHWAQPDLSCDNAVGVAQIGLDKWRQSGERYL